jgi:translation initiation factor 2 beta subunit (eIF-2beta)/eIF-5
MKKKSVSALQRRTLDARKRAESARQEARDAKARAREAHRLFKEAKKVAKKARAELEGLSKKLKKMLGPDTSVKGKRKKRAA